MDATAERPDSDCNEHAPSCPLCGDTLAANWSGQLYKCRVCETCRKAFARRRIWAFIADGLLFGGFAAMIQLGCWLVDDASLSPIYEDFGGLLYILFLLKDGFNGQSPGKRLFDLQVVDPKTGVPRGFVASFLRNIPTLFGPFALFIFAELKFGPRIGDGLANTRVIWRRHKHVPPFVATSNCMECGYDLTGNISGQCPECGTAIR